MSQDFDEVIPRLIQFVKNSDRENFNKLLLSRTKYDIFFRNTIQSWIDEKMPPLNMDFLISFTNLILNSITKKKKFHILISPYVVDIALVSAYLTDWEKFDSFEIIVNGWQNVNLFSDKKWPAIISSLEEDLEAHYLNMDFDKYEIQTIKLLIGEKEEEEEEKKEEEEEEENEEDKKKTEEEKEKDEKEEEEFAAIELKEEQRLIKEDEKELIKSIQKQKYSELQLLLEMGATVTEKVLLHAIETDNLRIVKMVLTNSIKLEQALVKSKVDKIRRFLIKKGANVGEAIELAKQINPNEVQILTSYIKKAKNDPTRVKRQPSEYNKYMANKIRELKTEFPSKAHKLIFKQAAEGWKDSPLNAKNFS